MILVQSEQIHQPKLLEQTLNIESESKTKQCLIHYFETDFILRINYFTIGPKKALKR